MATIQDQNRRSGIGKWVFILIVILLLSFISILIAGILNIVFGLSSLKGSDYYVKNQGGNVAFIKISGLILTDSSGGFFGQNAETSSTDVIEQIEKIKKDKSIKAVIFEINSGGGSGVAADEIATAIKSLKENNITTVSYIRDIGASAAYWIASSTDYIFANRLSLVGSIGVYGSYLDFSGLMENYNVTYQRFVAGKHKDFGVPFRSPTEEERILYQQDLDALHKIFIEEVSANRNISVEKVTEIATGFLFLGDEAKSLGLIDEIGGKNQAIKYVENLLNINATLVKFEKQKSILDLLSSMSYKNSYSIGRGIGDSLLDSSMRDTKMLFR